MALIRCPECGRQISDDAAMCMGCGKPMEKIHEQLAAEKEATRLQAEKLKAEQEAARLQAEKEKAEKAANKPANGKKPIGLFIALAAVIAMIAVVMVIVSGTGKVKVNFTKADVVKDHVITFGAYEQDNDLTNGKEPIEWIVLDVDKKTNRALVISRYGLDARAYQSGDWDTQYPTWEKSEIREWLNSTFLNAAFTAEEQKAIATATVKTGNNDEWVAFAKKKGGSYDNVSGGADTQDKVFLLSLEEAMAYGGYSTVEDFINNGTDKMKAVPTKYAVAQGAYQYGGSDSNYMLDNAGCCWWWLRSPGCYSDRASLVVRDGSLNHYYVYSSNGAVRPAFWLNLDSIIP